MTVMASVNSELNPTPSGKKHYLDDARICSEHYKFLIILALAYAFDQMDLFTFLSLLLPLLNTEVFQWSGSD